MNNSTIELPQSPELSIDDYKIAFLINRIVYRYYFLFLILAGTCGNLLTAITLLRPKLRRYTTCQFMAVCALLNIGVLLTNTLNMMLTNGHYFHLRSLFDMGWCRINAFISQWIRSLAHWVLVIVAFERFQQSKSVRRAPTRNSHIVFYTMFMTSLILIILNLHYLLFTGEHVKLEGEPFLACMFPKNSTNYMKTFFASTYTWQELVTIIIIPCVLTLILNIFIIKNSFLNPINNESLKSRSKSRTRRVTTMLLVSNIGFLALVGPAQIFYALFYDPHRDVKSADSIKSFLIKGSIYQSLINTYYAASFVFCFTSSSVFRREIKKLLHKRYKSKHTMNRAISGPYSSHEKGAFIQQTQISGIHNSSNSRINDYAMERTNQKPATESTIEYDGEIEQ